MLIQDPWGISQPTAMDLQPIGTPPMPPYPPNLLRPTTIPMATYPGYRDLYTAPVPAWGGAQMPPPPRPNASSMNVANPGWNTVDAIQAMRAQEAALLVPTPVAAPAVSVAATLAPDPSVTTPPISQITDAADAADTTAAAASIAGETATRKKLNRIRLRNKVAGGAPASTAANAAAAVAEGTQGLAWLDNKVGWGFGIHNASKEAAKNVEKFLTLHGAKNFASTAGNMTRVGGRLLSAAPWVALASAPVVGAMEGYQDAGTGGAIVQGGAQTAGTLVGTAVGTIAGGPIGAMIGGTIGNMAGGFIGDRLTDVARAGLDSFEAGEGGAMGNLGMAANALGFESESRKAQREFDKMQNSPQMRAIRQEQQKERHQREMDLLNQLYYQAALG